VRSFNDPIAHLQRKGLKTWPYSRRYTLTVYDLIEILIDYHEQEEEEHEKAPDCPPIINIPLDMLLAMEEEQKRHYSETKNLRT